jgi:hypothetical protein
MPRLFVTGGRQRQSRLLARKEWHAYDKAMLLELDTDSGQVRTLLEYASPPERCPAENPNHVFKAASWDGDQLLLCTQTEVLRYDPRARRITATLSHPLMNDVHHVARIGGQLHVVSTGLDATLVFEPDDQTLAAVHGHADQPVFERFDRATDYRRVPTTKPHACHPNYIHHAEGTTWVTRFEQRDAVSLDGAHTLPKIAEDPIHDGIPEGSQSWFTVVSGEVVVVDRAARRITARYNLDQIGSEGGHPLGWCRGIHRDAGVTWLAFSRLRPTALKQNLSWLRKPLGKLPEPRPTRVVGYALEDRRKLESHSLESTGISSIFSVLPADPHG